MARPTRGHERVHAKKPSPMTRGLANTRLKSSIVSVIPMENIKSAKHPVYAPLVMKLNDVRSHHPRDDGGQDGPNREQIGKDFRKLFKV